LIPKFAQACAGECGGAHAQKPRRLFCECQTVLPINAAADTTIQFQARLGKTKHHVESTRRKNTIGAIKAPTGYDPL
jgi:hypothetical protein